MALDDFDPATAKDVYLPSGSRVPSQLWSTDKLLLALATIGIVKKFEGGGDDPTGLTGYASDALWLRTDAGVTNAAGQVRRWNGSSPASSLANWPLLSAAPLLPAGVGATDGDKGDVTVSSQGTVWNIDPGSVGTTELGGDITAAKTMLALTPAADRFPYFTSSSASALATLTTFGRALIDDTDALAARTTLGGLLLGTVVTIAALRALTAGAYPAVVVTHYAAITDQIEPRVYVWDAGSSATDNNGTVIAPNAGTGRWMLVHNGRLNPRWFGATGDGSTNDQPAFQAAIDALGNNGVLDVTEGVYSLGAHASLACCLRITKNISIVGVGWGAVLTPISGLSSSNDIISIAPDPAIDCSNMRFFGLFIGNHTNGTRTGRHAVFVDTQTTGSYLPGFVMREVFVGTTTTTTNRAFYHINNVSNNVNGGLYGATIEQCKFGNGIEFFGSGDSNAVLRCIITGAGPGIVSDLVSGASMLEIDSNNITATGGAIIIKNGPRFRITNNNTEQTVAVGGVTAMIDVTGSSGTVTTGIITGNLCGAFTGTGITANIRLANCIGVLVEQNTLLPASGSTYGIDNSGIDTIIGPNTVGSGGAGAVIDTGTGTRGVDKTPTLAGSFTAYTGGIRYSKDREGYVCFEGAVAGAASGTITTLPTGFAPAATVYFPILISSGLGQVSIDSSGVVSLIVGHSTFSSLSGVRFRAADDGVSTSSL